MTSTYQELDSLSHFERKEYLELKYASTAEAQRKRERAVLLGFFVISLIATLMISGSMNFV